MSSLADRVQSALGAFLSARGLTEPKIALFQELWTAPKAALIAHLADASQCHVLVLASGERQLSPLLQELPFFTDAPVLSFPAHEMGSETGDQPLEDPHQVGQRMRALDQWIETDRPCIVLCHLPALTQVTYSPEALVLRRQHLRAKSQLPLGDLLQNLLSMGYVKVPLAQQPGEFALRAGLVDLVMPGQHHGCRIDFWGDEIESIRAFELGNQRSLQILEYLKILPAGESCAQKEERGSLLEYCQLGGNRRFALVLDDSPMLEDQLVDLKATAGDSPLGNAVRQLLQRPCRQFHFVPKRVQELFELRPVAPGPCSTPCWEFSLFGQSLRAHCPSAPFATLEQRFADVLQEGDSPAHCAARARDAGFCIDIARANRADGEFAAQKLGDRGLQSGAFQFWDGYLERGFALEESRILLISTVQFTGHVTLHRPQISAPHLDPLLDDAAFEPGEFVVHLHNGVGRFQGVEQRPNHLGELAEFLKIEYADRAQLYVPLQQTHLIDKFVSPKESAPRLHALGSSRWKTLKSQTEASVGQYAKSLLQVWAERTLHARAGYSPDSPQMQRFEEAFPYALTRDQQAAVAEIKADLRSQKLMDRLVCGDVGYGKTEVAMRAAFKTAVDGHQQVALLVPTTVLALQHFETFCERMSSFPLRIAQLSRFTRSHERLEILKDIRSGDLDIVIGTHCLLSGDLEFRDLGLVVVDEEQRFGVRAKEHLRNFKAKAHSLTLSATPIPRTLYMSLIGTRELSLINTPPGDRQLISTILSPANDQLIQSALRRELARAGQSFVIHNRVESLGLWIDKLRKLVPEARIDLAHGQMSAERIDAVFHAFKRGETDILLATSIVENGIDIPNANTLIVDRSDAFGLADLHQLRGRIGRWNRKAFAYFLYPANAVLPEIAAKRLRALQETSGVAGGMKIAMRDLEIRGCGEILGVQQSGQAGAVGFHLYCRLLKNALDTLQGKKPRDLYDIKVEVTSPARIPGDFVDDVNLRMQLYRRLGDCQTLQEIDEFADELKDRFGPPPRAVLWLLSIARVRCQAGLFKLSAVKLTPLTSDERRALLTLEKQSERGTIAHRVHIHAPLEPLDLEKTLLAEMENFDGTARKERRAQIAKSLKSAPHTLRL